MRGKWRTIVFFWFKMCRKLPDKFAQKVKTHVDSRSKNNMKKTRKMSKSNFFQMSVNQSIWVQIVFWIVQKKALGIFWPESRTPPVFPKNPWRNRDFPCQMSFFDVFSKSKKMGFRPYLLKKASYGQSDTWKKLTIFSYHPKKISKKSDQKFWKYRILLFLIL